MQDLDGDFYKGPSVTAEAVAHYLKDKKDVTILDVGAGTGLVAAKVLYSRDLLLLVPPSGIEENYDSFPASR